MTNIDDNLSLLSPCMFGNGNNSVDISHIPKAPPFCDWGHDNSNNSYNKSNIMTWSASLALTNEQSPLHISTIEPCTWKSSNFHGRESIVDDIISNCCDENVSKESEGMNVTWNNDLLLDDENTTDHSGQESRPLSVSLGATERTPDVINKHTVPKSRGKSRTKKTRVSSATYKHVPHRDKPPQLVARRNARERRRVQAVNSAFSRLRKVVPIGNNRGKRVSKVKTLHKAIEYISQLQDLLIHSDPTHSLGFRTGGNHADSWEDLLEDFEEDI